MVRHGPGLLKSLPHSIADSTELAFRIPGANDEIIGKAAYPPGIQQNYIARLFVAGGIYGLSGYFYRFQAINLQSGCSNKL
jgi:hypothetical protein